MKTLNLILVLGATELMSVGASCAQEKADGDKGGVNLKKEEEKRTAGDQKKIDEAKKEEGKKSEDGKELSDLADEIEKLIPKDMDTISSRLEKAIVDQENEVIGKRVIENIEKLLEREQERQQQQQQKGGGGGARQRRRQMRQRMAQQMRQQQAGQRKEDTSKATRSDETGQTSPAGKAGTKTASQLVQAVWGHLPPAVREQLNNAFSEEYLPKYEGLIRQYYERLATPTEGTP